MLPHIVHSIPRAAAVVQNQTHTLRNVLQLQSTNPSSGSGSGRGSGPGTSGSKYGTGSRFYSGLNSAGRAVTQANAVTSQDTSALQDDYEEITPRRPILPTSQKQTRMRSSSVSLSVAGRNERGEKMGVLKTVQLHARSKHVFAPAESLASAKERLANDGPLLVRRNSTSAPLSPLLTPSDPPPTHPTPPTEKLTQHENTTSAAPQTDIPTPTPRSEPVDPWIDRFQTYAKPRNSQAAAESVREFLSSVSDPTIEQCNAALKALVRVRVQGDPLSHILRLYDHMQDKSVVPNIETYEILIRALTDRDMEIRKVAGILNAQKNISGLEQHDPEADQDRMKALDGEENFVLAMSLFERVLALNAFDQLATSTCVRLLRSCSLHANTAAAIHVFAQLEARGNMDYNPYNFMIATFSAAKRYSDAEAIFHEYLRAAENGKLKRYPSHLSQARRSMQIRIWNTMMETYFRAGLPDKAIGLLDQMMQSSGGNQFRPHEVPVPTSSSFTTVIASFLESGDIESALTWFRNLCAQEPAPADPFEGLDGKAMQPDIMAWTLMIKGLAAYGKVDELNEIYEQLLAMCEKGPIYDPQSVKHYHILYNANMDTIATRDNETAIPILDSLARNFSTLGKHQLSFLRRQKMVLVLASEYISRGQIPAGVEFFNQHLHDYISQAVMDDDAIFQYHRTILNLSDAVYTAVQEGKAVLPFASVLTLSRLITLLGKEPELRHAPFVLDAYGRGRSEGTIPYDELTGNDWSTLLSYAVYHGTNAYLGNPDNVHVIPEFSFAGLPSLLEDMSSHNVDFGTFDADVRKRTFALLSSTLDEASLADLFGNLKESFGQAWKEYDQVRTESQLVQLSEPPVEAEVTQTVDNTYDNLVVTPRLSQVIEEVFRTYGLTSEQRLNEACGVFEEGLRNGRVPSPTTIARLIQGVGRAGQMDKVREYYTIAQAVLPSFYHEQQLASWVAVEDSMVIALAHSGHVEAAHVHRIRILEQGRAPSADAYGVLIQHVKDTTDDTSGALSLFQEAMERGVKPNLYLYNNIISKLSRARKADHALELFKEMKGRGISPSSITYGTVIGACARVGDVQSAQLLFQEMSRLSNYKPRVPPYNTMMQMYTTIKPNRASALFYYDELISAGVRPSAHTYKLLLDAYGSIEPVDLPAMERAFETLKNDKHVQLNGAHFASLINAYGCVSKDLEKAISIFESMPTIPGAPQADAVVFEAIINVIVAHKRTDLIPTYIAKMSESGVHMTAYIANFLIKGYANVGEVDRAREIFESLLDPPTGVAAPNNHAPHDPSSAVDVPVMEPVYREPSTWEAMVRAELGAGNRDAATALLERLRGRHYPEAVYNRINGIMTDFSVLS